jgi:hypothetical protein
MNGDVEGIPVLCTFRFGIQGLTIENGHKHDIHFAFSCCRLRDRGGCCTAVKLTFKTVIGHVDN